MSDRMQSLLSAAALLTCVFLGILLVAGSAALITVEFDEAWILASLQQKLDSAAVPRVNNVMTTGGVHHLVVGALTSAGLSVALAGRMFSGVCLLLLLLLLHRECRRWELTSGQSLFVLSMAFAAPGTVFLAGQAYGVVPGMLLFTMAMILWSRHDPAPDITSALWIGVCLGLAISTRLTYLPLLPVFLLFALLTPGARGAALQAAVVVTLTASIVFAIGGVLHMWTAPESAQNLEENLRVNTLAAGLNMTFKSLGQSLAFMVKYVMLVPIPLALGALVLAWCNVMPLSPALQRFVRLAVLCAILMLLAWLLRSPFQHIRYIWPSIFLVFIVGGVGLAIAHDRLRQAGKAGLAVLVLMVPLGLTVQTQLTNIRLIALGSATETKAAGQNNLENHYAPLRRIEEEKAIVDFLKDNIRPGEQVLAMAFPREVGPMQIALLSQRDVISYAGWKDLDTAPDYLLVHSFSNLDRTGLDWLAAHADLKAEVFGYRIFRPRPEALPLPDIEQFALPWQLYRFMHRRSASLSNIYPR